MKYILFSFLFFAQFAYATNKCNCESHTSEFKSLKTEYLKDYKSTETILEDTKTNIPSTDTQNVLLKIALIRNNINNDFCQKDKSCQMLLDNINDFIKVAVK